MNSTLTQPETTTQADVQHSTSSETATRTVRPRADIYELDDAWLILLEMPGVDENGTQVGLEKGVVRITGEMAALVIDGFEKQYGGLSVRRFERTFRLPDEVDATAIEAEMKAGILRLRLPKAAAALPTKVIVKAG